MKPKYLLCLTAFGLLIVALLAINQNNICGLNMPQRKPSKGAEPSMNSYIFFDAFAKDIFLFNWYLKF